MDLIFGDTSAHEEKERIKHIEANLRGTPLEDEDDLKPAEEHHEIMNSVWAFRAFHLWPSLSPSCHDEIYLVPG